MASDETTQRVTPEGVWRGERAEWLGDADWYARVDEAIEAGDVERSDATFALELASLASVDASQRAALFAGALAAAVTRRRGSVRLALGAGEDGEGLANRLQGLVRFLFDEERDAEEVAETLREVARGGAAAPIVGGAGEYRPLVVDDDHLYRHRDWKRECRLADALAERVDPRFREAEWSETFPWSEDRVRGALADVVEAFDPAPTVEQQCAVVTAALAPLSLITGGPGTGKTSLVVTLLRLLVGLGVAPERIALAAPTGKAADRLGRAVRDHLQAPAQLTLELAGGGRMSGESTPEDWDRSLARHLEAPATIHRLLGYSEARREFHHDAYRPLPYEYVVVDEASMIDLGLMDRLVAAIEPEARLVLVGDADQLPAVGSGAVFRDLVPSTYHDETPQRAVVGGTPSSTSQEPLAAQAVELTTNFRMTSGEAAGGQVLRVARAVGDGGDDLVFVDESGAPVQVEGDDEGAGGRDGASGAESATIRMRESFDALEFEGAELLGSASSGWLDAWYDATLAENVYGAREWRRPFDFEGGTPTSAAEERLGELFEAFDQFQLLGVTRRRPRGVERLDRRLHRSHVRRHGLPVDESFVVGEPVMMTTNDYERGLFNGDRGVLLRVRRAEHGETVRRVVFPAREGYAAFAVGPLAAQLDRAWSVTVHKAQGSEYGSVGIVLPTDSVPIATRELLYTGITRARRSVAFFGDPELIVDAARRSDERNTGLLGRLKRGDTGPDPDGA